MSRKLLALMIVFGMTLAGCATSDLVEVDSIEGAAEVPAGEYLLVEFITEITPCGRGGFYLDFPFYEYENGTLSGYVSYPDEHDPDLPIIGYFGQYTMPAPGAGYGAYSTLIAFQSLPFQYSYTPATVLSIDGKGTIVVDINGAVMELAPGESWSYKTKEKFTCWYQHERHNHTFIDHGFLEENQIQLTVHD